ncbi:EamA family transporter RarD [Anaeromyxobacter sp. SG26]|uniref:EamA family transporter RarD n=1 Tax=Anaeromyxobacter sp. SG26 TaxID=2925407 RepID=UPI001F575D65|nr:EamA family transporter RarD [Anaeromyxobacter sp. SG26]
MTVPAEGSRGAAGVGYAAAAYLMWGLFPLYFHALAGVPAPEILAYRIVCSTLFVAALVTLKRRWADVLRQLRAPGTLPSLAASALFISANWLVYVWAVNAGRVLEASLGYFVNPLVSVVLGVVFLREPLTRAQRIAVILAALGVVALVVRAGTFPWVALALALTFGLYGLIRKRVRVDATAGLLGEVALLTPVAAIYLAALGAAHAGHLGASARVTIFLAASGVVTAIPLMLFALGVQRLRLSTIGLLQYVNPTVQFGIAVLVFREPFSAAHALTFGCIWLSLAIYSFEALALARRQAG